MFGTNACLILSARILRACSRISATVSESENSKHKLRALGFDVYKLGKVGNGRISYAVWHISFGLAPTCFGLGRLKPRLGVCMKHKETDSNAVTFL